MSEQADLILRHGQVVGAASTGRASLVAVQAGTIRWVGNDDDLDMLRGPATRVIDCEGAAIVPGFIDAHMHLWSWAANLLGVDCSPRAVGSIRDITAAVHARAASTPPGTWVRGWGVEEFHLAERRLPRRDELDQAAPAHPVKLVHRSGHASVLNSSALARLGISEATPEPPGSVMERDMETGRLTGYLLEMEREMEANIHAPEPPADLERGVSLAFDRLLAVGITSIHEATPSRALDHWDMLTRRKAEGRLPIRVWKMVSPDDLPELRRRGLAFRAGHDWLRIGAAKVFLNETADRVLPATDELRGLVRLVQESGFQVAFHAAEEAGVAAAIDAVASARGYRTASLHVKPGARHRIEHCGVCPPDLARHIAAQGIVVVSQPAFVWEHGERYRAQVAPEKLPWLYPFATLRDAGVLTAFGSDCPVVPPDPLTGLMAAVTRAARNGPALPKEQSITAAEAFERHTLGGAYASFEEDRKGRIAPGYLADLAILGGNPMTTPPERLAEIRTLRTVVGGRVAWER